MGRVVDDGRVSTDEHQVIRSGGAGYFGEVPIAQGELPRVREVGRQSLLTILDLVVGVGRAFHPRLVPMIRIIWRRVLRGGEPGAMRAGKRADVVVEGMVFLDDNDDVLDLVTWRHGLLLCAVYWMHWPNQGSVP